MNRTLRRNKREFWYSLYVGLTPKHNEHGQEIGQAETYSNPVQAFSNISAAKGQSEAEVFGLSLQYDKSLVFAKGEYPIDETTVLYIDTLPIIENDGSTKTKHDFSVTRIAHSLNYTSVAVTKVS